MKKESFADRLKLLREDAGISQHELSRRAGLNLCVVSRLESGRRGPAWDTVTKLADALAVPTDRFRESKTN